MAHIFDGMDDGGYLQRFFISSHIQLDGLAHKMDTLPLRSNIDALYIRVYGSILRVIARSFFACNDYAFSKHTCTDTN